MDYEKKYKEALERARKELQACGTLDCDCARQMFRLFPELKESEDERIKKDLIGFFKDGEFLYHKKEEIVEWLEKQSEKLPVGFYYVNSEGKKFYSDTFKYGNVTLHVEKQGEKPQGKTALEAINEEKVDNANKIEPKFKVGDWIINRTNATIMQIVNNKDFYESVEIGGQRRTDTYNYVEWDFRLWSIEDAKDGDVLIDCYNNIVIYQEPSTRTHYHSHCYYYIPSNSFIAGAGSHEIKNTKPATKEQRDILFAKMKEAGYEWDAKKKELKIKLKEPDGYDDNIKWSDTDKLLMRLDRIVDCNIDQLKCLNNIFDKLNEIISKLGDIYEVLSKPYVFPYRDYTSPNSIPGMDVWYKTHGVDKVPPVTCETTDT